MRRHFRVMLLGLIVAGSPSELVPGSVARAAEVAADDAAAEAGQAVHEGVDRVRQFQLRSISDMRLRMLEMLRRRAAEEAAIDRRALLGRKLAVDSALAPALLLLELSSGSHHDPLGILRVNYRPHGARILAPRAEAAQSVDALGAAWAAAGARGVDFSYRSERFGAVETDFPALIEWRGRVQGPSLELTARWYEPFVAQRRLDFPLNPENLRVVFTRDAAQVIVAVPSIVSHGESFRSESPALVNPSDLYDLFDALRIGAFVLRSPPPLTPGHLPHALLVDADADPERASQQAIREIEWTTRGSEVERCDILQPVVLLHYETAHKLVGEAQVGTEVVGGADVLPQTELIWFPTGLHAAIDFRAISAERDQVAASESAVAGGDRATPTPGALRVPDRVELRVDGVPVARSQFGTYRIGGPPAFVSARDSNDVGDAVDRRRAVAEASTEQVAAGIVPMFSESEILGSADPLVARWRLRSNLLAAAKSRDASAHDYAVALMRARLLQDGVEPRWLLMNLQAWIEELAGPIDDVESAATLALPAWLAVAEELSPSERLSEILRLVLGGRWALALALARTLHGEPLPPGGQSWIEQLEPELEKWSRDESLSPARAGTNPEWDARVDRLVIAHLDALKRGDTE